MEILSSSLDKTKEIALTVAKALKKGDVIVLKGNLGAGKTTFTQFLLSELGIKQKILSPTFVIMNEYEGDLCRIYHIDMYRLTDEEALGMGFYDVISNDSVVIIEWNKIQIPAKNRLIRIDISYVDENSRLFKIEGI